MTVDVNFTFKLKCLYGIWCEINTANMNREMLQKNVKKNMSIRQDFTVISASCWLALIPFHFFSVIEFLKVRALEAFLFCFALLCLFSGELIIFVTSVLLATKCCSRNLLQRWLNFAQQRTHLIFFTNCDTCFWY